MTQHKHTWIAVIGFALVFAVVGVGKPAAGGDDNGQIEGIGHVIVKGFSNLDFEGGGDVWRESTKKDATNYECQGQEGCYFLIQFSGVIGGNCTTSSDAAGTGSACSDGFVEEPLQFGSRYRFHCEDKVVVTTYNDLVWIPEGCYPDFFE